MGARGHKLELQPSRGKGSVGPADFPGAWCGARAPRSQQGMMQGLAQHSNQHNWLPRGSPEDAAPHAELCARVVAACEVLACLHTQPAPAQPWSPALRAPQAFVASELLVCRGAGEDSSHHISESVSVHPLAAFWLQPEQGWWQEGTVPIVTPGWGAVACSKASLCASALLPSFHNQL